MKDHSPHSYPVTGSHKTTPRNLHKIRLGDKLCRFFDERAVPERGTCCFRGRDEPTRQSVDSRVPHPVNNGAEERPA
eukprot:522600-Prorocentrum_minimum.AAC.2